LKQCTRWYHFRRLAKFLLRTYREYRYADDQITELVIRIEGIWIKTEIQVRTLTEIRDSIDERLCGFQQKCLQQLLTKLRFASVEIEAFTGSDPGSMSLDNLSIKVTPVKKARYSLLEKHLQSTVREPES
jgi:hypothetical protein